MARPSEVATKHVTCYVEPSSKRGTVCLGERGSRSGEKVSPKRDIVVKPLFHTRSGEVVQLKRDRWTSLGEDPWLKREWREFMLVCTI
ncbi:hypothetical protein DEO72_LG4g621 [Vigna unguiculata]|uniref:Uncharacterized protein n=1 Tax=Vigna unguiculata TaxID=3917 RepID=A0A4D6LMV0_VIGUN|nr:hypothetical protein DEO72_LG4g621 [Vigna unguiculata]